MTREKLNELYTAACALIDYCVDRGDGRALDTLNALREDILDQEAEAGAPDPAPWRSTEAAEAWNATDAAREEQMAIMGRE